MPRAEVPAGPPGDASERGRAPVYLQPGQLHAAAEPTAITTILGSCVAVCLSDAGAGVGGMNHFLLPRCAGAEPSPRFGDVAVGALVDAVARLGASRGALRAKVFGGAALIGARPTGRPSLGEENVRVALSALLDLGIPVLDGDVGGGRGRKVVFHTDDGCAWMRTL